MAKKRVWFASGNDLARSGPFASRAEARESMRLRVETEHEFAVRVVKYNDAVRAHIKAAVDAWMSTPRNMARAVAIRARQVTIRIEPLDMAPPRQLNGGFPDDLKIWSEVRS